MDRLERELEGQAQVLKLSVVSSVGRELASRYGVRGVPTFFLFDGKGQMVHHQVGRLDADRIHTEIELLER